MRLDTRIYVVIVVPDADPHEASPLQGFAPSLCDNSWMIRAATRIPSDVFDLTPLGRATLLARRKSGLDPIHWFGQTPRAIRSHPVPDDSPFLLVFLPPTEDPRAYKDWSRLSSAPPTIVAEEGGDLSFSGLGQGTLQQRFLEVCDSFATSIDRESAEEVKRAIRSWVIPDTKQLHYQVGGHNSVAPNLLVLESTGFRDMVYGPFSQIDKGTKPYVDQIVKTANTILEMRSGSGASLGSLAYGLTLDLNLFAPSIFPHILRHSPPQGFDGKDRKDFLMARRLLEKQSGYGFTVQTPAQAEVAIGNVEAVRKGERPTPHPLFWIRRQELDLSTECVSALAVSELVPVIRLPNEVNRISGAVRNFSATYRSAVPISRKRTQGFQEVQRHLARAVPEEFVDLIRDAQTGVRIIADSHLEWLDIDGIPLSLRKSTTRIPVTPGNLFIQVLKALEPLYLTPKDLTRILVLSALEKSDPVRRAFEIALNVFQPEWKDILQFTFCEIGDEDDLANALNGFEGCIAIFDGHGVHEPNESAKIYLKGKGGGRMGTE